MDKPREISPARRADGPDLDLIAGLYARTPAALLGHAAGALALLLLFWTWVPAARLLGWLVAFSVVWGLRLALAQGYRRARPARDALQHWRHWQAAWNCGSLACGAVWALAVAIFYEAGQGFHDTALILLAYSYCIGAPAASYRVFVTYTLMCFAPMLVHVAAEGLPHSVPMAGLIAGGLLVTLVIGRQYRRDFDSLLALKIGNEQLAAQLAHEKAVAEAARSRAEEASRAKTRFFTAASHDLRQPLHALALFAETLRQRAQEGDTAQLAGSIAESVAVLETLFGELLDLGRLEAGGVEPHARHFPLQALYDRLRPHFEPQAFDKGLALRFRGAARWAHADPLLVERVLRNLVANALRYTEDGGVLVGCRPRGATLRLEVWDSGVGIPAEALPRIFDEFYQVGSARAFAGAPRGGSGLGLSIAHRLARLMGSSLQVASVPGRGSVFWLELPAGQVQPANAATALVGNGWPVLTLAGRQLLVVEDDAAARHAMVCLLRSWQAEVTALASLTAVQAWLGGGPGEPDLLIVDQHLPGGHCGGEVIAQLRARFGAALPAIMVTGRIEADDEAMAQALDCHLLYKPVAPNRLRALIGFKLADRRLQSPTQ